MLQTWSTFRSFIWNRSCTEIFVKLYWLVVYLITFQNKKGGSLCSVRGRSTLYVCNNPLQYQLTKFTSTCSLRKQLTFGFPAKLCPRNKHRDSILVTCHYPDLGRASDWVNQISHVARVRCLRWLVPSACKLALNKNPRLNPTLSLACSPLFSDPIIF